MIYSVEEIWGKSDHSPQSMKILRREALITCAESDPCSHKGFTFCMKTAGSEER